ncbi:MAG: hypothetical protein RRA94_04330 [Bacteroidota bacterium]|nr:hypothetical protein [Bacteroidota bacterium]
MRRTSSYGILFLLLPLLLAGCTDNPFESAPAIAPSQRTVRGTVQLSNTSDHSGVYVWLEEFDLSTTTGSDGNFSLTLPPPAAQGGGGVSGVFRLWTFLGNYNIRSVRIAVKDGSFVYPSTAVDENGRLREALFMQQRFSFATTLSMTRIEADSPRFISMQVELRAPAAPSDVYFPRMVNGVEGPVFLRNLESGQVKLFSTTVTGIEVNDYVRVADVAYVRSMLLSIPKYSLQAGQYEVVPYLLPRGMSIPSTLLNSLGEDVTGLNPSYLSYPFRREGGRLDVTPN